MKIKAKKWSSQKYSINPTGVDKKIQNFDNTTNSDHLIFAEQNEGSIIFFCNKPFVI